jgi:hypothetical protein
MVTNGNHPTRFRQWSFGNRRDLFGEFRALALGALYSMGELVTILVKNQLVRSR